MPKIPGGSRRILDPTVHLKPDVWKALKLYAVAHDRQVRDVLADAVREYLAKKGRVDLRTLAGVANGGKSNAERNASG